MLSVSRDLSLHSALTSLSYSLMLTIYFTNAFTLAPVMSAHDPTRSSTWNPAGTWHRVVSQTCQTRCIFILKLHHQRSPRYIKIWSGWLKQGAIIFIPSLSRTAEASTWVPDSVLLCEWKFYWTSQFNWNKDFNQVGILSDNFPCMKLHLQVQVFLRTSDLLFLPSHTLSLKVNNDIALYNSWSTGDRYLNTKVSFWSDY